MSKIGKIKNKGTKKIIKEEEYNEEFSIKKFIGIIIIILVILGLFYLITTKVAKKKEIDTKTTTNSVINTDMVTIGNMLSKKESDYYVLIYYKEDTKKSSSQIYEMYLKDIKTNDDSIKFYVANLSDAINKLYIDDTSNITDNLKEFKVSEDILLHIVNNKISESFVGSNDIASKLLELKGE